MSWGAVSGGLIRRAARPTRQRVRREIRDGDAEAGFQLLGEGPDAVHGQGQSECRRR
jgi:hypothetical protein